MSSFEEISGSRARTLALALAAFLSITALVAGPTAQARPADGAPPAQDAAKPAAAPDGVYTEDQSRRGKAAYGQSCSPCHGDDLNGDQRAPALVGETFTAHWTGQSIGDLFDSVRTGMPMDNPGSLSDSTFVDIVAYVLQRNNFPAGKEELKADNEALKKLTFTRK